MVPIGQCHREQSPELCGSGRLGGSPRLEEQDAHALFRHYLEPQDGPYSADARSNIFRFRARGGEMVGCAECSVARGRSYQR
jgi:hypothetical protein